MSSHFVRHKLWRAFSATVPVSSPASAALSKPVYPSLQLHCQQSRDVHGTVRVPVSLLPAVFYAFHVQRVVTVYTSLVILMFLGYSPGVLLAAMTFDCG